MSTKKWFPVSANARQKAERFFNRYGVWSLLFTWLPVVGDGIALVSGVLRTPLRYFLPLVLVGKAARYALILWGQHLFLTI
jgi:membrane protein YqaA with SNARE-associated domain